MKIKVESEKVKITIGEQSFELSRNDVRVLRDALNKELGDTGIQIIEVPQKRNDDYGKIPFTPTWYPKPYEIWCLTKNENIQDAH